jgi:hypothetical protein
MAARVTVSALLRTPYARHLFEPVRARIFADGTELPTRGWTLLVASTLMDVGLKIRITYRALERPGQRLGLRDRAREPVEDEPLVGVGLGQAIHHHLDHHGIGHVLAAVHEAARLHAERGALLDVLTEDVARRDLRDAVALRETLRLRSLACARGLEEDETHRPYFRKPS